MHKFNILYHFTVFDTILQEVAAPDAMLELLLKILNGEKFGMFRRHEGGKSRFLKIKMTVTTPFFISILLIFTVFYTSLPIFKKTLHIPHFII